MVNSSLIAGIIITAFWAIVGCVVPWFIWCGKPGDRWTVRVMLMTAAFCCYLFWLLAILAQFRPLFGPEIKNDVAAHARRMWTPQDDNRSDCFPVW